MFVSILLLHKRVRVNYAKTLLPDQLFRYGPVIISSHIFLSVYHGHLNFGDKRGKWHYIASESLDAECITILCTTTCDLGKIQMKYGKHPVSTHGND